MTKPKYILYAEDDAVTLTAYKNRLEQSGYMVQAAVDGLEALKWLHQSPPDLLLLDLVLPKFNGEEVLKYINSNPALAQIPVIVLSTNSILNAANEPLIEKARKRFLKHDCRFPKLLSAIEDLLANDPATATAGRLARIAKCNHEITRQSTGESEDSDPAVNDPLVRQIRKMQDRAPVVCAWTDRINIEGKWMKLTEFLSEQLQLKVTHGVSPEGVQKFFGGK